MFRRFGGPLGYRRQIRAIQRHEEGRIAIIGCSRSGTTYASELFRAFGYAVGHESLLRHGISSWCLTPDTTERCWGPSWGDVARLDLPIVHQVRHPLRVISSMTTAKRRSWRFITRFIPIEPQDSLIHMCMKYWYHWNLLAERKATLTYGVENVGRLLPELFRVGGFDSTRIGEGVIDELRTDVNAREHTGLTWTDLEREDADLTSAIRSLAETYGYGLDHE